MTFLSNSLYILLNYFNVVLPLYFSISTPNP